MGWGDGNGDGESTPAGVVREGNYIICYILCSFDVILLPFFCFWKCFGDGMGWVAGVLLRERRSRWCGLARDFFAGGGVLLGIY